MKSVAAIARTSSGLNSSAIPFDAAYCFASVAAAIAAMSAAPITELAPECDVLARCAGIGCGTGAGAGAGIEAKPLPVSIEQVGIDVGLNSFAVLSDGAEIQNPRYYRKAEARLRRCQRKVARRTNKKSNRRRKAVQLLQRANAHVRNQRADFAHKESRKIVNRFGLIAVEDLNVKGLAAGMLAKSVNDAAWSLFFFCLSYKAASAGREFRTADARGTSQTCLCGAHVPKTLADRWHACSDCGLSAGRDHVSAQVILQRAVGSPPSSANVEAVSSFVA